MEDLWFGNVNPSASDESDDIKRLVAEIGKSIVELTKSTDNMLVDKLVQNYEKYSQAVECEAFIKGFCLAVQLFTEVNSSNT